MNSYNNMSIIKKVLYISLVVCLSCSHADKKNRSFAESWNSRCPIAIVDDGTTLAGVKYTNGDFVLSISLNDKAPTSIRSLFKLNEEYSKRIEESVDYMEIKEIGGLPFVKGVIYKSPIVCQLIDTISSLTYTPESTQGFLPIIFCINDGIDSLSYRYNEDWEQLSEHEWLNAIMPIDMCNWTSGQPSSLPPINDIVEISGIPRVNSDGFLRIYCSYAASPAYTRTGKPMNIEEVKIKYFNKEILETYLSDRMRESKDVYRYLNACMRRGIRVKFIVKGFKDGIDYDLTEPESIKQWESWGGSDSIVISSNIFMNTYK